MSGPQVIWHGATISARMVLPNLAALAAGATYNRDNLPRRGFNHLWGWIAADDTFTVAVSMNNLALGLAPTVEGTGWLSPSGADPVTPFQVVNFDGLHLTGDTWNILITGVGLNMGNIHYWLEMKP